MENAHSITAFDRLDFRARMAIAWAFFWRAVLVTGASTLGGGVAGFVLGIAATMLGTMFGVNTSGEAFLLFVRILAGAAGLAIGIALFWQYIRWLFGSKLGGYDLRLVLEEPL